MPLIAVTCMYDDKERRSFLKDGYIQALERVGAVAAVLPPSLSPQASAQALSRMDGLLLSGGTDVAPLRYGQQPRPNLGPVDPLRDEQEFALVRKAIELGLPILGICRGMQVINAVLGGDLIQHIDGNIQHQQQAPGWHRHHSVRIEPGTILARALGRSELGVNSFHHQAVGTVAPGLKVSARSPDGIIEAVESSEPWILAVQWHPELMWQRHEEFLGIFRAFVGACRGEENG